MVLSFTGWMKHLRKVNQIWEQQEQQFRHSEQKNKPRCVDFNVIGKQTVFSVGLTPLSSALILQKTFSTGLADSLCISTSSSSCLGTFILFTCRGRHRSVAHCSSSEGELHPETGAVLTVNTLSGSPLARMFVSWMCLSTIQASSCLPVWPIERVESEGDSTSKKTPPHTHCRT